MHKHVTNQASLKRLATTEQLMSLQHHIGLRLAKGQIPFDALQSILGSKSQVNRVVDELARKLGLDMYMFDAVKERYRKFLTETFTYWYDKNKAQVEQVPLIVSPQEQNFATLAKDVDSTKFGEYTINPDMEGVDWENISQEKIKILAFEEFRGKPLHELAQHIVETYSDTHHIPGIEFWQWVVDEYDNALDEVQEKYKALKDGNYHFCFGSLVRLSVGSWRVPYANRDGSEWHRRANWLGSSWVAVYRVVLLEK